MISFFLGGYEVKVNSVFQQNSDLLPFALGSALLTDISTQLGLPYVP